MSLRDKILKNSTIKETDLLVNSSLFGKKDMITTPVPMINVALSGRIDGGLTPGLLMLAGPSKHFKTAFSLLMAYSYLKKYPEGILLFYDSEFGTPRSYFDSFKVATNNVVHTPLTNIEELKHDIINQLKGIDKGDKLIIIIDSLGNLASKKELDDAEEGKTVADMSRAKAIKSLFRMITPYLTLKDIPLVVINHTYKEMGMFPKDIVSGGTGSYYSSENIWIIGRQQEKEDNQITGYNFIINVEKSRYVREKSKIPVSVSYEGGIKSWSGFYDLALEGGYLVKEGRSVKNPITNQLFKPAEIEYSGQFWKNMLQSTNLGEFINKKYSLSASQLIEEKDDAIITSESSPKA